MAQGRRPVPTNGPGPAFWPLEPTTTGVVVCDRCCCILPATDRAQQTHRAWHEQTGGRS